MICYCSDCKSYKNSSNFHKSKRTKTGHSNICKSCSSLRKIKYNSENPQQKRQSHLQYEFGLLWETYETMFNLQNGTCAICKTPLRLHKGIESDLPVACVDHNHSTGKVRGLLCKDCNLGLGKFKDSLSLLENASEYLNCHGSIKVT